MDHCRSPRNFHKLEPATVAEGHNPLCGDRVTVYLRLDNNIIQDVSFQGEGCAISKASASIMTEALKGKTREEARAVFDQFHELVTSGQGDEDKLGKLAAFAGVAKYPARVKCAILPWHAIVATLQGESDVVSTE